MAQVSGYSAERMKAIEDSSIVNGEVDPATGALILTRFDGTEIDAGVVSRSILVVTSSTRPTPAVEGMVIYETDTDQILAYDGSSWVYRGGLFVCTSTTRPSAPFEGLQIYETDTDRVLTYIGTAWTIPKSDHVYICTSGTRPSSGLYEGFEIYETDTNLHFHYTGSIWLPRTSSFRGVKNVDQSIPTGTGTTSVTWADEVDDDGWHAGTAAEIVVPTGFVGSIIIDATLRWEAHATGYREAKIVQGGATTRALDRRMTITTTGVEAYNNVAATVPVTGGESFTIECAQNSGVSLNVETTHSQVQVEFVAS